MPLNIIGDGFVSILTLLPVPAASEEQMTVSDPPLLFVRGKFCTLSLRFFRQNLSSRKRICADTSDGFCRDGFPAEA